MEIKFMRSDTVSPTSLGQYISVVGTRGLTMSSLAVLEDLDTMLALTGDYNANTSVLFMGGRSGLKSEIRTLGAKFKKAVIGHEGDHYPLVVDIHRQKSTFAKNKTIIQVRGLSPYNAPQGSFRVGYFLNTNVAYVITLTQLADMLDQQWPGV